MKCKFCSNKIKLRYSYLKKPKLETDFSISKKRYKRFFYQCTFCKHFFSIHNINIDNFYRNNYFDNTYKNLDNALKLTKKILSYPASKSDNKKRVERIIYFFKKHNCNKKKISILDIGSGLGVFPYVMKKKGFKILSQEVDPRYVEHHKKNLNLNSTYGKISNIKKKFHFITLNKVLEHIADPFKFLLTLKKKLKKKGVLYIEVPSSSAANIGKFREEFFIEHFHVFSLISIKLLANLINAKIIEIKDHKEPSGKFTLSAFFLLN